MNFATLRTLRIAALAFVVCAIAPAAMAEDARPMAGSKQDTRPLTVFAAASLQTALNAVAAAWKSETGKEVTFSYASSSALAKQLEAGAPADVFASADLDWMDWVEKRNLIRPASRQTLLGNRLVLIAGKDDPVVLKIAPGFGLAGAIGTSRLATGNTASVPAGKYAKAALTSLAVWEQVSPLIAGTDNVRAALALVARGEAKFGIVYATDAKADERVRVVDVFPATSHAPIVYPFALTAGVSNPDAAAFLAFLASASARAIFEAQGFSVLQ